MAKSNLASMTIEALIEMRDDIGKILSAKTGELQRQFAALGDGGWVRERRRSGAPKEARSKARRSHPNIAIPRIGAKPGPAGVRCLDGWPPKSRLARSARAS